MAKRKNDGENGKKGRIAVCHLIEVFIEIMADLWSGVFSVSKGEKRFGYKKTHRGVS